MNIIEVERLPMIIDKMNNDYDDVNFHVVIFQQIFFNISLEYYIIL